MGRFLLFLSFFLNTANIGFAGTGPQPWQLGFRPPATPTMEKIVDFHNYFLNPIIIAIALFVIILMGYIIVRFSEKNNPKPPKTTNNTTLEIL